MATDKLWSKKCSSSSSVADRRTGDGVRRQLEYALASFIKEMKKWLKWTTSWPSFVIALWGS
jgi:hypothetical protein